MARRSALSWTVCFLLRQAAGGNTMANENDRAKKQEGAILVPALLWWAGVPLGLVILLWLFFFRG
jgi:hypothetical protein